MHGAGLARIFLWHWLRPRPRGAELVYCCDYISLKHKSKNSVQ